jgi:Arc/MetJ family transcription regulator
VIHRQLLRPHDPDTLRPVAGSKKGNAWLEKRDSQGCDVVMYDHQTVRTTLEIDDDLIAAARELAGIEGRSIGSVVSDLIREGLTPTKVDSENGFPVIRVPAGSPPITPEMVRRAIDED